MERLPVKGFEGLYEVDEDGNVYSIVKGIGRRIKKLTPRKNNCGYVRVNLHDADGNSKKKFVHRIVAEVFIPNPKNLPVIDHIDCNVENNKVSNLRWCTQSENIKHSWDCGNQVGRTGKKKGGDAK